MARRKRAKPRARTKEATESTSEESIGKKAHWEKGSVVEIWSHVKLIDKKKRPYADPNTYMARCMSSGTFPVLEVIDDDGDRHPLFPLPLFEGQYAIWRVLI